MTSFFAQIMEPGGGVMLIPFVRLVVIILLMATTVAAVAGLARLHMVILAVLSGGLLLSLSFFEAEYKKVHAGNRGSNPPPPAAKQEVGKTD